MKTIVKQIIFALVIISPLVMAETFVSDNFKIEIEGGCEEGIVSCDQVTFTLYATGFDVGQTILGTTKHSACSDGVTPCAFQGYEFYSNGGRYFLYKNGFVEVTDSEGNVLLAEQGEWQY